MRTQRDTILQINKDIDSKVDHGATKLAKIQSSSMNEQEARNLIIAQAKSINYHNAFIGANHLPYQTGTHRLLIRENPSLTNANPKTTSISVN